MFMVKLLFDQLFNSLSPGRYGCDFKYVNFKHILGIDIQVNITLEWIHRFT